MKANKNRYDGLDLTECLEKWLTEICDIIKYEETKLSPNAENKRGTSCLLKC